MTRLRRDFKQTNIGTIPKDWQILQIGDVGEVLGGRQRSPGRSGEMTPYLRVANVFEGFIDQSDILTMPFTAAEKSRFLLREGDILLNEGQSLELVGRSAVYRGRPIECCFQNTLVRFRVGAGADVEFYQRVFERYLHQGVFASIALQTTSIAHLGAGRLAKLEIPVPPLIEQKAIAEALSDAEGLIASLEKLIAKKRGIKQGTMQKLLTGQRRLSGFQEEWTKAKLDALAEIRSGGTPSTARKDYWDGEWPWCTPTDITALSGRKYVNVTAETISELGLRNSSAEIIPPNSVIMTSRATIGECAINVVPVTTNQGFKNFVPRAQTDTNYLYYLLISKKADFVALCSGSTFLEIGKKQLREFIVRTPPTLDEQRAIASVLSDMDAEIAALEDKLAKARAVKQGMMQVLLTGEVRLV